MSERRAEEPAVPRLAVEGLRVALGGEEILHGIDLAVPAGRTVAVLGPSGCGKTTLLRAVAGLVDPSAGRVLLDGEDVTRRPTHRRGVGLMFQDHALFPHRDVGSNVAFGLRMRGDSRPDQRARVAEVLELVGLGGWERRKVGSLSGGEAQRVALARALAPAPGLLCLDEPLGSLDRVLHDRLVDDLRRLFAELGLSVVHVTHDQREALALADRLVVMGEGRILQHGAAEEVWRNPATEEVARFLGQDAILDVEVKGDRVWLAGSDLGDGQATPEGPYRMVVTPDAVEMVDTDGQGSPPELLGTVVDVAFEGDRTTARIRPDSAQTELKVHVTGSAAVGERVGLRLDLARATLLGPDPSESGER